MILEASPNLLDGMEIHFLTLFRQPVVENLKSRRLIDDVLLLAGGLARSAQFFGCACGAESFVAVLEGKAWNLLNEFVAEESDPLGGLTLAPIEAERQAQEEEFHLPFADDLCDAFERVRFFEVDRFDRMGGDAKQIGGRQADAGLAVIDGEDGMEFSAQKARLGRSRVRWQAGIPD